MRSQRFVNRNIIAAAVTLLMCNSVVASDAVALSSLKVKRLSISPAEVKLGDARSRQQLIVTAHGADGHLYDVSRQVVLSSNDSNIASVDKTGVVRPQKNGKTIVRATFSGQTAEVMINVSDLAQSPPVSFTNEVMAVIGKAGCNSGACHGHNSGKGGFKLSLRGYDLASDHKSITDNDHGRIELDDPAESLILKMPSGQLEHGGGKRFDVGSDFYEVLRQWLTEGAKSDIDKAVPLGRIEVLPEYRVMPRPGLKQQLVVLAHFADGSVRDVTHQAIFELSNEGVLEVSPQGLVTTKTEGEAAVFVRFLGQMGLSRCLVIQHKPDFVWRDVPANNFIDSHIYAKQKQIQVTPSELTTDSEFLRRVSFDTIGAPPTPKEVRSFLADSRPNKRAMKIDELLDREEFGDQWALYWLELSGTTESGDSARFKGMWTFALWLRESFNRNLPYDQFVRAAVAGKGSSLKNPAVSFFTNQLPKVETVPQLFLGVRLRCAQCHDHPFDVWKRKDYRALGEFFADLGYKEGANDPYGREIHRFVPPEKFLPWERDKKVKLRLPDGSTAEMPVTTDRRDALVDWMFGSAKKLTARAIVNRVWGRILGRGIVDPVDDMRFSNPPVNEPLLNALAEDFIAHRYDFKQLVRTILKSRTYQLNSKVNPTNKSERMNFSHARLRRLPAEQLLDAISQVTGVDEKYRIGPPGFRAVHLPYTNVQSRFLTMFGRPNERMSACECIRSAETTLPQVMHLLNGETVRQKLRAEGGSLAQLLAADLSDEKLVEEIYITILSRPPSDREKLLGQQYLADSNDQAEGAEDLTWALITSQEFMFNH